MSNPFRLSIVVLALGNVALTCSLRLDSQASGGDEVRIVEDGGVRYRETRSVSLRPVTEVRVEQRQVTTQSPEQVTRLRPEARVVQVPVPGQQVVTQRFWWNPWRWGEPVSWVEPVTIWQPRIQTVWVPSATTNWVPTTQTVKTAERYLHMERDEQVSRVALGPANGVTEIAQRRQLTTAPSGGIARLGNAPPKQPTPPTILVPGILR